MSNVVFVKKAFAMRLRRQPLCDTRRPCLVAKGAMTHHFHWGDAKEEEIFTHYDLKRRWHWLTLMTMMTHKVAEHPSLRPPPPFTFPLSLSLSASATPIRIPTICSSVWALNSFHLFACATICCASVAAASGVQLQHLKSSREKSFVISLGFSQRNYYWLIVKQE